MSRLIDASEAIDLYEDIGGNLSHTLGMCKTVEAVPLEPLCQWLAGYAAPPKYAIDACGGAETMAYADKRVEAWKYHFKNLMGCDLL